MSRLPWDKPSQPRSAHSAPSARIGPVEVQELIGEKDADNVDESWIEELREASVWLTKSFWVNSFVRAARTFVQTVLALAASGSVGVFNAPWQDVVYTSLGAAGLSILMSIDRSAKD